MGSHLKREWYLCIRKVWRNVRPGDFQRNYFEYWLEFQYFICRKIITVSLARYKWKTIVPSGREGLSKEVKQFRHGCVPIGFICLVMEYESGKVLDGMWIKRQIMPENISDKINMTRDIFKNTSHFDKWGERRRFHLPFNGVDRFSAVGSKSWRRSIILKSLFIRHEINAHVMKPRIDCRKDLEWDVPFALLDQRHKAPTGPYQRLSKGSLRESLNERLTQWIHIDILCNESSSAPTLCWDTERGKHWARYLDNKASTGQSLHQLSIVADSLSILRRNW